MNKILDENKKSWDKVAHHFNGIDALPSYGPFTQTEEELLLFGDLQNKKVLDIGYGSGHSLRYMAANGVSELWGVDISESQKAAAEETLKGLQPNLYCSPMEIDCNLPKDYFDYVYSIYAIGWTTDLAATFQLIYSYLKPGGVFIFSWDHPLYPHLQSENGVITLTGSYQEEGFTTYNRFKGEDATVVIPKRKMATYLNELIRAGFTIQKVIESDVPTYFEKEQEVISDRYYSLYKARKFPTTMIIKAVKE
jgi:SAM-dependent methyltransferase